MAEIEAIIRAADITDHAKEVSLRIFGIIACAEAKAHGVSADQVHFHEVGAVDSIVDVVAFAVCFDDLGLNDVVVERLCEGRGTVRCQHGVLPVPVPAVSNVRPQMLSMPKAQPRGASRSSGSSSATWTTARARRWVS